MKKLKRLWLLLSVVACVCMTAGIAACETKPEAPTREEGSESGVYYYTAGSEDWLLSLDGYGNASFIVSSSSEAATYTLENGELVFTIGEELVSATYSDDTVSVTYQGTACSFIRRTPYTVTFETNGGSAIEAVTVINGKRLEKPEAPVRENYVFLGWYLDEAFSVEYDFSQSVTSDFTLYAQWADVTVGAKEYTVDFDLNYEGAAALESVETVGGKLYHLPEPERVGYSFKGWWVSHSESADKLTYQYTDGVVLTEDTVLFALWESTTSSRLSAPAVQVLSTGVFWDSVSGASSYALEVTGPDNYFVSKTVSGSEAIDFSLLPAGEYTVKVTAKSPSGADKDSETTVRYYTNKMLARVSGFTVVDSTILLWNAVEKAEKYYITIDCGNADHSHTLFDNGDSTSYNFSTCQMQPGGITFTVTAAADGYASSVSRTFTYNKELARVEELSVDESSQTVSWSSVPYALEYSLVVNGVEVYRGSKTSYSFKDYEAGEYTIAVTPVTNGYNSPEATVTKYVKITLASPTNLRFNDSILSWDAVEGAESYTVIIDNKEFSNITTTSVDLLTLDIDWENARDYSVSIIARGEHDSLPCAAVDARYMALYSTIRYSANTVSWRPVIGAKYYEVNVNEEVFYTVTDGSTSYSVSLLRAGNNTVAVRFFDGEQYSAWVSLSVYAYTVSFDACGGDEVVQLYVAYGDSLVLPVTQFAGYEFAGWYSAPNGGTAFTDTVFSYSEDVRLFAHWTASKYTVTLDAVIEVSDPVLSATVEFGKYYTLYIPAAVDTTKIFRGWYSTPVEGGVQYTDETGVSVGAWSDPESLTLYARWANTFEFEKQTDGTYTVRQGLGMVYLSEVRVPQYYQGENDAAPVKVTTVEALCFANMANLKTIYIPDTVTLIETTGDLSAFYGCANLVAVNIYYAGAVAPVYASEGGVLFQLRNSVDGTTLSTGTELAFFPRGIKGVYTLPDYVQNTPVQRIPEGSFSEASVTEIILPSTVTYVARGAFVKCASLKTVSFKPAASGETPATLVLADSIFNECNAVERVVLPARLSSDTDFVSVFTGNTSVKDIDIEAGGAFGSVDGLITGGTGYSTVLYCPKGKTGVNGVYTLPANIVAIGTKAFEGCLELREVRIPDDVTEIGAYAFQGCENLSKIVFVAGVIDGNAVVIGDYAFAGLTSLLSVELAANTNVAVVGDYAFQGCTGISEMELTTVRSIGSRAFDGCTNLRTFTFPVAITSVGDMAFNGCTSLSTIRFISDMENVQLSDNTFSGCSSITTVELGASVSASINLSILLYCDNLTTVIVDPNNAAFSVEDGVLFNKDKTTVLFYPRAKQDTGYVIPSSVTTVGSWFLQAGSALDGTTTKFYGAIQYLKSITIGANVTLISDNAFNVYGTSASCSLETVTFAAGGTEALTIGNYAFYNLSSVKTFSLPQRTLEIGSYAFAGMAITSIEIKSATVIGNYAFMNCRSLSTVTLGEVTTIGDNAFQSTALTSVNLPEGLVSIGASAFSGCSNMVLQGGLPTTLKSIGKAAFSGCSNITFTTLPSVESIGESAFSGTGVVSVVIPASVTSIPAQLFYGCSSLISVVFEEGSQLTSLGTMAFANCTKLATVKVGAESTFNSLPVGLEAIPISVFMNDSLLTSFVIHEGVTEIGTNAFGGTGLTSVVIPEGVATIGENAFYQSALVTVVIPASVSYIGMRAFGGITSLTELTVKGGDVPLEIDGYTVSEGGLGQMTQYAYVYGAFAGCTRLTAVELPARITSLGAFAFAGNTSLTEVSFAEGSQLQSYIGSSLPVGSNGKIGVIESWFYGCTALENITFASESEYYYTYEGVLMDSATKLPLYTPLATKSYYGLLLNTTEIAENYFKNRTDLTEIIIPAAITKIGDGAFAGCTNLTSVTFADGTADLELGASIFSGCTKLTSVELPARVTVIDPNAFSGTNLVAIEVAEGNSAYSSYDGVLLNADATKVLIYPTAKTSFTLPETVTEIGEGAFSGSALTSIELNDRLVSIGSSAFDGLSGLTEITLNSGLVTIGEFAFRGTGLKKINIPNTVETIGQGAFNGCASLTSLTFEAGGTANLTIGDAERAEGETLISAATKGGVFYGTAITQVTIPSRTVKIGVAAFVNLSLQTINLREDGAESRLQIIGDGAFYSNNVRTGCGGDLVIPSTVTYIGDSAFNYLQSITSITFEAGTQDLEIGASAFAAYYQSGSVASEFALTIPARVTSIGASAFAKRPITSLTFEEGSRLKTIGASAFAGGSASAGRATFTSLEIPASVSEIGDLAFQYATNLSTVTFLKDADGSSSLLTIGSAFSGCTGLRTIEIPNSVTTIKAGAFYGLGLTTLTFASGGTADLRIEDGTSVTTGAFGKNQSLTAVELPSRLTYLGAYTFYLCSGITTFRFAEGFDAENNTYKTESRLGAIGNYAFAGSSYAATTRGVNAASIVIPKSVTSIGNYAFTYCISLTSVIFESGSVLQTIGDYAFRATVTTAGRYVPITSISIPASVKSIGTYAFAYCYSLTTVTFEKDASGNTSLQYIGAHAFRNTSIQTIVLPDTVKSLTGPTTIASDSQSSAFYQCTSLTSVTLPANLTHTGQSTFYGCTSLTTVNFGEYSTLQSIGYAAFSGCSNLTDLKLPSSLTSIGASAFANCLKLTELEIPDSVTEIGGTLGSPFAGSGITEVELPSTMTTLPAYIFKSWTALTSYTIPDTITEIGESAFYGCTGLTSISIPSSVQKIGKEAFYNCTGLQSVTIASGVTEIGEKAFYGCKNTALTSITVPDTVTTMGAYVFYGCTYLTSVTLSSKLTAIPDYAFQSCTNLTTISIPSSVTSIGISAFQSTKLSGAVVLPEGLTTINNNAFNGTAISGDLVLPGSVTTVGAGAFYNCTQLETVTFKEAPDASTATLTLGGTGNTSGVFGGCTSLTSVTLPARLTDIGKGTFYNCKSLAEVSFNAVNCNDLLASNYVFGYAGQSTTEGLTVTFGAGVTKVPAYLFTPMSSTAYSPKINEVVFAEGSLCETVGSYAFAYNTSLGAITIPSEVTSIGSYAFMNNTALTSVVFAGNKLKTINDYAFSGCTGISNITLPSSLQTLGAAVFNGCTGLTSISLPDDLTTVGSSTANSPFAGTKITTVALPANMTAISAGMFRGWTALTSVTIPEGITAIGDNAFYGCTGLTSIVIPSSVTSFGTNIFYGCTSLEEVTLPSGMTSIPNNMFYNCSSLTSLDIPESVTSFGDYSFFGTGFTSFEIPEGVTTLGNNVFQNAKLTSITIPSSVTTIGNWAFAYLPIKSIEIPNTVTSIGTYLFAYCTSLAQVTLPSGLLELPANIFQNCTALTAYTVPATVRVIGNYAFSGSGLTSVTVPSTVNSLGTYVFQNCASLKSAVINVSNLASLPDGTFYGCTMLSEVTLPETVTQIGSSAFYNCKGLEHFTIPKTATVIGTSAFSGSGLTEIVIPNTVTSLGTGAFYNCTSLQTVTFEDAPASSTATIAFAGSSAASGIFSGCTALTTVTLPNHLTSLGKYTFYGCTALTTLYFNAKNCADLTASSNTSTSNYVFYNAGKNSTDGGITMYVGAEVTRIPAYLSKPYYSGTTYTPNFKAVIFAEDSACTTIGTNAFYATALTYVVLPASITSVENQAFYNCNSLTAVYYYGTQEQWNAITIGTSNTPLTGATVYCKDAWTLGEDGIPAPKTV